MHLSIDLVSLWCLEGNFRYIVLKCSLVVFDILMIFRILKVCLLVKEFTKSFEKDS